MDDINPQAPKHSGIIPKQQFPMVNDLTEAQIAQPGAMILRAKALAAEKAIADSGSRLIFIGDGDRGPTGDDDPFPLGGRQPRALP